MAASPAIVPKPERVETKISGMLANMRLLGIDCKNGDFKNEYSGYCNSHRRGDDPRSA
jgi:hypothetical protein